MSRTAGQIYRFASSPIDGHFVSCAIRIYTVQVDYTLHVRANRRGTRSGRKGDEWSRRPPRIGESCQRSSSRRVSGATALRSEGTHRRDRIVVSSDRERKAALPFHQLSSLSGKETYVYHAVLALLRLLPLALVARLFALARQRRLIDEDARREHRLLSRVECDLIPSVPRRAEERGGTYIAVLFPIVDRALLRHELVNRQLPVPQLLDRHTHYRPLAGACRRREHTECSKLLVALVDLARPPPETGREPHRGEDAVVVEQETLERLLDEDEVEVGQSRGNRLPRQYS